MKIALFGATGGTGQQLLEQAIKAGHQVTALVRDPAKLDRKNSALTVIAGNVLQPADVDKVVSGADAVICSLGNTSNNPDMMVTQGTRNIIDAMQRLNVRRLLVVSSLGVGDSKDQVPFFFKVLMKTALRKTMEDKEAQEAAVRASRLDWTIVRPGGLTNDPPTGTYRVGTDLTAGRITRADVADFILKELTRNEYIQQTPGIT